MSIPTIQMATAMRMVVGRLMRGDSGRMMALYLQMERVRYKIDILLKI